MTYPRFVGLWFIQLDEANHAKVFRATWAFCGDRTVADDATQEAFARALEHWPRLREQPWGDRLDHQHRVERCPPAAASPPLIAPDRAQHPSGPPWARTPCAVELCQVGGIAIGGGVADGGAQVSLLVRGLDGAGG